MQYFFLLFSFPRTCFAGRRTPGWPCAWSFSWTVDSRVWKTTGSGVNVMLFLSFHHRKTPWLWELTRKILRNDGAGEQDSRISKMNFLIVAWKALEIPTALWKTRNGPECSAPAWPHPRGLVQHPCAWQLSLSCGLCWWSGLVLSKAVISWKLALSHLCQCLATPWPGLTQFLSRKFRKLFKSTAGL